MALEERQVDFAPLDFFTEGPVKDQDIYYVTIRFPRDEGIL